MARPLRVEFEGAIYHVTVRGNARQRVFVDDRDRNQFLKRLGESVETYDIRLYLFCLMSNHFHLLLETPRANLARFMQSLQTAYAVYFNLRHDRAGHLTQGRYVARLVEEDEYLLRLTRYVHLNPVFVGNLKRRPSRERINYLRAYTWSSYRSYIGGAKPLEFVEYGPILAQMECRKAQRAGTYRAFVERGLVETDEQLAEVLKASPRSIGSDSFRQWVDRLHAKFLDKREKKEDVSFRRRAVAIEPHEILDIVSRELKVPKEHLCRRLRGSMARPIAAHILCKYAGITQRRVADMLGLGTGAAVSLQLKKVRERLTRGRELKEVLARIDRRLSSRGQTLKYKIGGARC